MAERTKPAKRMPANDRSVFPRKISLNIGTIIFGILFVYIIISTFLYMTARHVTSYQVTAGPLAKNQTFTGLAVRSERVITADSAGYLSYYARENSRIRKNGVVYGISSARQSEEEAELTEETLERLGNDIRKFSQTYDSSDFFSTYSLKYQLEGDLLDARLSAAGTGAVPGAVTVGNQTVSTAGADGIVCYTSDGYEQVDVSGVTKDLLDEKAYHITNLKTSERIQAGDPVYKLVDSENWSLVIPLTARQIVKLDDVSGIRVKFLKDGITQKAAFRITQNEDGSYFGILDFDSGMIRYISDRFIRIELVTNNQTGLKIPVSSIVSKSFFTVPVEYATEGGDSQEIGFLRVRTDENGAESVEFTSTTLYEMRDGKYYIDSSVFQEGDIILKENTASDRYIIRETDSLEGVYNMNKGYAVFRKINIIDKNEDYCIVEKGTPYGIAQYDNIVLDASKVKESQITAVGK